MLPVHQAISFVEIIRKGGRTQPWVCVVYTEGGLKKYVVKLFQRDQEEQRHSVVNEVVGHVLAKEFDLATPNAALIEFPEGFIMTLNRDAQMVLGLRDERIKFGTEVINDPQLFTHSLDRHSIATKISIETLFAFDNLILNGDRNSNKPNLLVTKSNAYIIDHELAFNFKSDTIKDLKNGRIDFNLCENHIFFKYLSRMDSRKKAHFFNEFEFYLQELKINQLEAYFSQLESFGYTVNREQIVSYLTLIKDNPVSFVNGLKAAVQ